MSAHQTGIERDIGVVGIIDEMLEDGLPDTGLPDTGLPDTGLPDTGLGPTGEALVDALPLAVALGQVVSVRT